MAAKRHTQGGARDPANGRGRFQTCPFVHQGNYYCPLAPADLPAVPAELDVSINEVIRDNQS